MKKAFVMVAINVMLFSCSNEKSKAIAAKTVELNFKFEKVVVINLKEVCVTYLKLKITNHSDKTIILQDNSLAEH